MANFTQIHGNLFCVKLFFFVTSQQYIIASVVRHQMCELVTRVICECIQDICFFRDFMGLKRQKFSWSFLAWHLYTRQLACEPQTGSLAYFSVAVRNGTKKTTSFLDQSSTSSNMQATSLAVPLCKEKQC